MDLVLSNQDASTNYKRSTISKYQFLYIWYNQDLKNFFFQISCGGSEILPNWFLDECQMQQCITPKSFHVIFCSSNWQHNVQTAKTELRLWTVYHFSFQQSTKNAISFKIKKNPSVLRIQLVRAWTLTKVDIMH